MAKAKPLHLCDRQLLGQDNTARFLGISRTLFYMLKRDSRFLKPLKINNQNFWRVDELRAWLQADCPHPDHWVWRPVLLRTIEKSIADEAPRLVEMRKEQDAAEAELTGLYEAIRLAKARLDDINHLASTTARG